MLWIGEIEVVFAKVLSKADPVRWSSALRSKDDKLRSKVIEDIPVEIYNLRIGFQNGDLISDENEHADISAFMEETNCWNFFVKRKRTNGTIANHNLTQFNRRFGGRKKCLRYIWLWSAMFNVPQSGPEIYTYDVLAGVWFTYQVKWPFSQAREYLHEIWQETQLSRTILKTSGRTQRSNARNPQPSGLRF